jgi:hypothetical protein
MRSSSSLSFWGFVGVGNLAADAAAAAVLTGEGAAGAGETDAPAVSTGDDGPSGVFPRGGANRLAPALALAAAAAAAAVASRAATAATAAASSFFLFCTFACGGVVVVPACEHCGIDRIVW